MKYKILYIPMAIALFFCACKKDLGNYKYNPPSEPIVVNFTNGTFNALVGDTLRLEPYIQFDGADYLKDLSYQWDIYVDEDARTDTYTGYPLAIVYKLPPKLRNAKLTVTDKRNGIKYFFPFKIQGNTQFSTGITVLSVDNGVTKLSFVKPDRSVLSNLYFSLMEENLPNNPVQLFAKPLAYQAGTAEDYWVICQDPTKNSVIIDGNTMLRKRYFNEQFFVAPATITPQSFEASMGVPTGVINNKLYLSITSTAPFAPDFGKFSNPQSGTYTLSQFFTRTPGYFFGFDLATKAFVSFDGGGNYMGADYTVKGKGFNPLNTGMSDIVFMQAQPGQSYAYFRDTDGKIYEHSFYIDMDDYSQRAIETYYKREFKGESYVKADTKWQKSAVDIFYFTSDDKIYRYNPLNQDLRTLDANMGGKKVSMIKLSADGNTLTAGVPGSLYTLDVSVGKNGVIVKQLDGIPGSPVDIVIK